MTLNEWTAAHGIELSGAPGVVDSLGKPCQECAGAGRVEGKAGGTRICPTCKGRDLRLTRNAGVAARIASGVAS